MFYVSLFLLLLLPSILNAQAPRNNGVDKGVLEPIGPRSKLFRSRENENCLRLKFRALDGTCTSLGSRDRQLWGSTNRPHFSYFDVNSKSPVGSDRPSARLISNELCKQSRETKDERGLSEMATFFGQFIDHTIVATPLEEGGDRHFDIKIPAGDPLLANHSTGFLPFVRSKKVPVGNSRRKVRPQNSLPSAVDLASVYGPETARNEAIRELKGGLMKTSGPNLLPLNADKKFNAPITGRKFFLAGDHRANEHPVLTCLHTVFMREHNDIAKELAFVFPDWQDDEVFNNARRINIAQMQRIVYDEWLPSVMGRQLKKYKKFNNNVDPTVSVVFSTAAFRVGHTMVGNMVTRAAARNVQMKGFDFMNMFFTGTGIIKKNGCEDFLRGAMSNHAQKVDLQVTEALRNFLFTNVPQEDVIDLVANNIQRCRDHGCPNYVEIRKFFRKGRGKKVKKFSDITKNRNVQSAMQSVYGTVEKVDAWIGLVAEDHARGSSLGETLLAIWKTEFERMRDGDRFYFRVKGYFTKEVLSKIPRAKAVFENNADIFRDILERNTKISKRDIPRKMFFVN